MSFHQFLDHHPDFTRVAAVSATFLDVDLMTPPTRTTITVEHRQVEHTVCTGQTFVGSARRHVPEVER